MKKWLRTFGVFLLGVATIPAGLLIDNVVSRYPLSRNADVKFITTRDDAVVGAKAAQDFVTAQTEPYADKADAADVEPKVSVTREKLTATKTPLAQLEFESPFDDAAVEPLKLADNSPRTTQAKLNPQTSDTFAIDLDTSSAPQRVVPKRDNTPQPNDGIDALAEQNASDEQKAKLTTLREKLSELIKAKAELINEQTLTNEISTIEKQISDLHAAQKLLNAQQILKTLIEEFPNSPAAQKALRMLDAAGVPKSASKLEPIPEPEPFG